MEIKEPRREVKEDSDIASKASKGLRCMVYSLSTRYREGSDSSDCSAREKKIVREANDTITGGGFSPWNVA